VTPAFILVVVLAVILAVLSFIALKYPGGRKDWSKDRSDTASLLMSIMTFTLLFLLLWYASATADWPSAMVIAFWTAVCAIIALLVLAIIFPKGLDIGQGKEKDE
jgi:Kef-type K+ transport system membrane component KefB